MRKLWRTAIICLSLSTSGVATLAQSDQIAVRLSLDKQQYEVQEQIPIKVEVENRGEKPLIVSNLITTDTNDRQGHIEFELIDTKGHHQVPQLKWIGDSFAPYPAEPDWRRLLGLWLVLYPKDSLCSRLSLDGATFPFLTKPGKYKISATYSSAGLAYGANYGRLGLKAQDVSALPYRSWSGKVQSNSVWITVGPSSKPHEQ
jgi:hypothetical protein